MLPMTPVGKPLSRCSLKSQRGQLANKLSPFMTLVARPWSQMQSEWGGDGLKSFQMKANMFVGHHYHHPVKSSVIDIRPALPLPLPLPLGLPSNIHLPRMPPLLRFLLILSFLDSFDLLPRLPRVRLASPPYPVLDDLWLTQAFSSVKLMSSCARPYICVVSYK